ncbi:hypothetical protein BY996DRAFT_509327 [Phakopsora pachyrhizi]|uniref:Expressed protein n=1 Tax=Phakopsora pachyrhizi TaxID=170000 RepID=A0AAV0AL95_PHAPC|nr:hypothetical protein BY996DRAFT_1615017 [Phakopsora pachyrhizi]KAI8448406.1 hypothetical protein BY996DRAFT_509327 [Phakopsora pachyrhizi]CAH7669454.1 expressed protein [Phakopsora pachyrhizi]
MKSSCQFLIKQPQICEVSNFQRRTSVDSLDLFKDPDQPVDNGMINMNLIRRNSFQSVSNPALTNSQSLLQFGITQRATSPDPFRISSSPNLNQKDLSSSTHRPMLHLQNLLPVSSRQQSTIHAQSLPNTPSSNSCKWLRSSHTSFDSTLAPEKYFHQASSATCSITLDHCTTPSTTFDLDRPEPSFSNMKVFSSISLPSSCIHSLSLANFPSEYRQAGFFDESTDSSAPKQPMGTQIDHKHIIIPAPQDSTLSPFVTCTPPRSICARSTPSESINLQIDPSLIPGHPISGEDSLPSSDALIGDTLFSGIKSPDYSSGSFPQAQTAFRPGTSSPLDLQSLHLPKFCAEDPILQDMDDSPFAFAINTLLSANIPTSQANNQRSSSLPPPVIADSTKFSHFRTPGTPGARNYSTLNFQNISKEAASLFDDDFSFSLQGYIQNSFSEPPDCDIPVNINPVKTPTIPKLSLADFDQPAQQKIPDDQQDDHRFVSVPCLTESPSSPNFLGTESLLHCETITVCLRSPSQILDIA